MKIEDVARYALPGGVWRTSEFTGSMSIVVAGRAIIIEQNCFWVDGRHYPLQNEEAIEGIRSIVRNSLLEAARSLGDAIPNGYMCGVDFQHEVGEITSEIFSSVEDCEAARRCTVECGIVRVALVALDWPREQKI